MRYYSSNAVATSLTSGISNSATSISVGSVSGFPVTYPYTLSIDAENASKEIVEVTNAVGTTLTVTRGADGTDGVSHSLGAVVRHDHSARDFREPQEHMDATDGVHGVTGDVVGDSDTQTLTNKDLSDPTNTFPATMATDADVQAVADDLADHLADASDAHDASAISFSPTGSVAATDAQAAIAEVSGDIDAHVADATDAHDASAISFTPTGTIAGSDVQTAVAEVATDAAAALTAALPAATILTGAWASVPTGYLLCDGTSYATATYPDLFAAIGYKYGGAGANFNVPDLTDKFARGGVVADRGSTGGAATHTHPLSNSGWAKVYPVQSNDAIYFDLTGADSWTSDFVYTATGQLVSAVSTSFSFAAGLGGDTDAGSTLPPYVNFVYVIKT